jgi:copper(I)-binding protein
MTMMRQLAGIALPAGETIAFAPGGKHLMIFGLDPKLKPRDRLRLTFRFRAAPPVEAEARLVGPADGPPGDGD